MLRLGLKFNNPTKKPDVVQICKKLIVHEKKSLSNTDISEVLPIAKGIIYGAYLQCSNFNFFPKRLNKALTSIKKDPNIHITREDK